MKRLTDCLLYAFVDTAYLRGRAPEVVAAELCRGGADLIQLRAKQSSREEILRMATAVLRVTASAGVGLVINDHPEVAVEVGAALCHLGQEDFFDAGYARVSEVRTRFESRERPGVSLQFGLSTHAPHQALRAMEAGADYIAIGPVYATGTKPSAQPVTLEYVRWAAVNIPLPWFAIGGINLENLEQVLAAGARRICVVSAILNSPDVASACRQFKARLVAHAP